MRERADSATTNRVDLSKDNVTVNREVMFESPRKSINVLGVWSESQEELHEMQPVSPVDTSHRVKKKKKKRKTQTGGKRSVSAPQLSTEAPSETENLPSDSTQNNNDEPIVRGIFQIGKRSHDVVLTASRVTWTPIQPETPTGELRSVFSVSMTISFCSLFRLLYPRQQQHFRIKPARKTRLLDVTAK